MSEPPFTIPPVPLMTAERAGDVARAYQGLAQHLAELGVTAEAGRLGRTSQSWMTYAITLASTSSGGARS